MEKLIIEFINTLDRSMKKYLLETGNSSDFSKLSISQFQYIETVSMLDLPTITDISEKIKYSKPSVTTGVRKLVEMGYMEKISSIKDRRKVHVSLTGKAINLVQAKQKALEKFEEVINTALDEQELKVFQIALIKINNRFSQE